MNVVESLGWVQGAPIPVAATEGGVVLDLSELLPDLTRAILRAGSTDIPTVVAALIESGHATPHLSLDSAERLATELDRAVRHAEDLATVPETESPSGGFDMARRVMAEVLHDRTLGRASVIRLTRERLEDAGAEVPGLGSCIEIYQSLAAVPPRSTVVAASKVQVGDRVRIEGQPRVIIGLKDWGQLITFNYVASDGVRAAAHFPIAARLTTFQPASRSEVASLHRLIDESEQSSAALDELCDLVARLAARRRGDHGAVQRQFRRQGDALDDTDPGYRARMGISG